jgi:hypothetical protein
MVDNEYYVMCFPFLTWIYFLLLLEKFTIILTFSAYNSYLTLCSFFVQKMLLKMTQE